MWKFIKSPPRPFPPFFPFLEIYKNSHLTPALFCPFFSIFRNLQNLPPRPSPLLLLLHTNLYSGWKLIFFNSRASETPKIWQIEKKKNLQRFFPKRVLRFFSFFWHEQLLLHVKNRTFGFKETIPHFGDFWISYSNQAVGCLISRSKVVVRRTGTLLRDIRHPTAWFH
jgi:hypothetical protein